METLIAPTFNFLILLGILGYYLREPCRKFITDRHRFLRDEVERVAAQLKEAQDQLEEFSAKLKALNTEVASLKEQAVQDGKNMRLRILSEARKANAFIVGEAQAASQTLFEELRLELHQTFADRVIKKTEDFLKNKLTGDDRLRIYQEFSTQVETFR